MLKQGFTLAEVLITLMIVGVVATLTTPALVKNVGSSKIGPQLSKFVNTFETAAETLMMNENVGNLRAAVSESWITNNGENGGLKGSFTATNNLLEVLSKYMIMSSLKDVTNPKSIEIKSSANETVLRTVNFSDGQVWQLKDGTIVILLDVTSSLMASGKEPTSKNLGTLYVDIGGIKGKHRAGKEVFAFVVDDAGYLIPYGSNAHKAIKSSMLNVSCNHNGDLNAQLACTGAVADNGYKAPW